MSQDVGFDLQAAHRYFSAACFNKAWDLIDQPNRTPAEDEEMLRLSLASTWHWTQRADCTAANRAVGYWQTARIYALLGQAENARRYGQLSLVESQHEGVAPFYLGYAYEALARAERVAGDLAAARVYLAKAHQAAGRIEDPEAHQLLLDDLNGLA
jgi:hypothetical protein